MRSFKTVLDEISTLSFSASMLDFLGPRNYVQEVIKPTAFAYRSCKIGRQAQECRLRKGNIIQVIGTEFRNPT